MSSTPLFPAARAVEERSAGAGQRRCREPERQRATAGRRAPRPHPHSSARRPQLREQRAGKGPGPLTTRQEVPRAALSMLSGSVCAGVDSTLPVASPARQAGQRAGGIAGRRLSPRGGGHCYTALVPRTRAPASCIPLPLGPGASLPLLPPHWPVAEPALSAQVRGGPSPAHTPGMTPPKLLRGLSAHLPSPATRLQPAQPKLPLDSPLKNPQSASPRVLGACCLPWIRATTGRWAPQGASPAALRVPQSSRGRGTHAGGRGAARKSPRLRHPRFGLSPPAPSSLRPPRSALRASSRGDGEFGRDRPDPVALTSVSGSSSSRERPPVAVPAGPKEQRGTELRRPESAVRLRGLDRAWGHRGCRGSRRAAAELVAAGTVCKLPALAGLRAARPHSARTRQRHSSGAQPTMVGVGPQLLPTLSYLTSPTSPRF